MFALGSSDSIRNIKRNEVLDTLFRSKTDLRPNSQKVTTDYKLDLLGGRFSG